LDFLSLHDRHESFGLFLARAHLALAKDNYRFGQLNLQDIRDVERPRLMGLLKEQAITAMDPLRSFFPPIDLKTGMPQPFRPAQPPPQTLRPLPPPSPPPPSKTQPPLRPTHPPGHP